MPVEILVCRKIYLDTKLHYFKYNGKCKYILAVTKTIQSDQKALCVVQISRILVRWQIVYYLKGARHNTQDLKE